MEMELGMPPVVKVLQVCQISPPSGSVSPTTLPLTFFDVIFLSMCPVQRLFYYHVHHTKTPFMEAVLPNLKHSLSLTLQHLFPLAGNLTWPPESAEPEIVYKEGDAVSLTVAESDLDFDMLSGNQARDAIESYPLIPMFKSRSSDDKQVPLLALQVTFFPNKGICIGMTISHVASDGRSSIHFMKSWASVCLLQGDTSLITAAPPFYERSLLDFLNPKKASFLNALEKNNITKDTFHNLNNHHSPPLGKVQATYVMDRSDIKLLKQWVSTRLEEEKNETTLRLTSFVVTCAYVWVCFVKARAGDNQTEAIEYLIVPTDERGRLVPPLPTTYFGNCIGGSVVKCSRSDLLGKYGIATAAKLIGNEIQNIDLYKQLEKDLSEYLSMPPEQVLGIASSPRFGVYDIDFGWGKPRLVEMSSIHTGQAISVSEWAHEEGGLEFGLVRNKIEMETFARIFADSLKALSSTPIYEILQNIILLLCVLFTCLNKNMAAHGE